MLADIPPPPAPPQQVLLGAAVACMATGLLLVLWGRSVGRILLPLAAAAGAAAVSVLAAPHIPYGNVWVIGLAAAGTAGFLVFVLIRVVWSLALGVLVAAALLALLARLCPGLTADPPAWQDSELGGTAGWLVSFGNYLCGWIWSLWRGDAAAVALCGAVPVLAAVALGIFLPRAATIMGSSLLGAVGLVGGVGLIWWARSPGWLDAWTRQAWLPVAAVGLLALTGLILQSRTELQKAAQARSEEADKPTGGPARAGGKTDTGRDR